MTVDKAISLLRAMQEPEAWEPQITQDAFLALDMAIEALKTKEVIDMVEYDDYCDRRSRSNVERNEGWLEWSKKIPALRFDSDWDVKIIPPFMGALTRFAVDKGTRHVSVYLDVFAELGMMYDNAGDPIPYFEVFDGENTQRFYLTENDEMMEYIRKVLN